MSRYLEHVTVFINVTYYLCVHTHAPMWGGVHCLYIRLTDSKVVSLMPQPHSAPQKHDFAIFDTNFC
jgi:hypothetical protein